MTTPDEAVEAAAEVERVLREHGLSDDPGQFDSNIHSWRCEYPDHYGPCSCFQELRDELAALMALGEQRVRERLAEVAVSSSGRPSNDRDGACICDYNPETTEGPVEDCPFHGRPYAYWIERGDALQARAEKAEADLAAAEQRGAVKALRDAFEEWPGLADAGGNVARWLLARAVRLADQSGEAGDGE